MLGSVEDPASIGEDRTTGKIVADGAAIHLGRTEIAPGSRPGKAAARRRSGPEWTS